MDIQLDYRVSTFHIILIDVITIDKTRENYRVLYDVQGKFILKSIKPEEAKFKLVKVT